MRTENKTLIIATNHPKFFLSHRQNLALESAKGGLTVIGLFPKAAETAEVKSLGYGAIEVQCTRKGINPLKEVISLFSFYKAISIASPTIYHGFTIKPVIYGAFASRLAGVPKIFVTITGLGSSYLRPGLVGYISRALIKFLYRLMVDSKRVHVIFQNQTDQTTFFEKKWIKKSPSSVIPGTGVDLSRFTQNPESSNNEVPVIVFPARFLRDKGIFELIAACDLLPKNSFQLILAGSIDPDNLSSVSLQELEEIKTRDYIQDIKFYSDIRDAYKKAAIVCLPSYREGLPLALIEAQAMGLPVVTTDVPGCRNAIFPGESGLLVPPFDSIALKNALQTLLLAPNTRKIMGVAARKFAVENFDHLKIIGKHLHLYFN